MIMNPFQIVLIYIVGVAIFVVSDYIWLSGKALGRRHSKTYRIISMTVMLLFYHVIWLLGLLGIIR